MCEYLLLACKTTGNVAKARFVVAEATRRSIPITLKMYTHLVHVFGTAMRLPGATEQERLANIRHAWEVNAGKRRAARASSRERCGWDLCALNDTPYMGSPLASTLPLSFTEVQMEDTPSPG